MIQVKINNRSRFFVHKTWVILYKDHWSILLYVQYAVQQCVIFCFLSIFKKKNNRLAALMKSTSITEEKKREMSEFMTVDYMSSEESASEDDEIHSGEVTDSDASDDTPQRKKVLVRRPLPWRSQELNKLVKILDRKIIKKKSGKSFKMSMERRVGQPSQRAAPEIEDVEEL